MFGDPSGVYEGLTARMKALAVVRPLLALDRSKVKAERGWEKYLLTELALAAIDIVTLRTDSETAVRQDVVVEEVAGFAAIQQPTRPETEHREVARWVTERLINIEDRSRGFSDVIVDFPFQIFREVPDKAGQAALTVTDAAINVLVHAIDVDIASAQIAAEAKLEALLKRARIGDAWRVAHEARLQSIRYSKDLRERIDGMKRNVRTVDWAGQVEESVEMAREHVRSRSEAEGILQEHVSELLAACDDADKRRQLEDLQRLIGDCLRRHASLTEMLLHVGTEFRLQQDRQVFVAPAIHMRVHLEQQLLLPVLDLPLDDAIGALSAFTRAVLGPKRPHVLYLPDFFEGLARVSEQPQLAPVPVRTDLDGNDAAQGERFSPAQEAAVDALLEGVPEHGVRLSALLQQTRESQSETVEETDTDRLLVLRVGQLFREVPVSQLVSGMPTVLAVDDGIELDDEDFGGCDFLLMKTQASPAALRASGDDRWFGIPDPPGPHAASPESGTERKGA